MDYFLATSNALKLEEYRKYGCPYKGHQTEDISEPYVDILRVAAYKALKAGPGACVEDTALQVKDANIGVLVRYLEHELDQYVNHPAVFQVALARNDGDKISVYYADTDGKICKNRTPEAYGFDGSFVPYGANESIYELDRRGLKYLYSPRKKAVEKLINNFPTITFDINFWDEFKNAPLQEEVIEWIKISREM